MSSEGIPPDRFEGASELSLLADEYGVSKLHLQLLQAEERQRVRTPRRRVVLMERVLELEPSTSREWLSKVFNVNTESRPFLETEVLTQPLLADGSDEEDEYIHHRSRVTIPQESATGDLADVVLSDVVRDAVTHSTGPALQTHLSSITRCVGGDTSEGTFARFATVIARLFGPHRDLMTDTEIDTWMRAFLDAAPMIASLEPPQHDGWTAVAQATDLSAIPGADPSRPIYAFFPLISLPGVDPRLVLTQSWDIQLLENARLALHCPRGHPLSVWPPSRAYRETWTCGRCGKATPAAIGQVRCEGRCAADVPAKAQCRYASDRPFTLEECYGEVLGSADPRYLVRLPGDRPPPGHTRALQMKVAAAENVRAGGASPLRSLASAPLGGALEGAATGFAAAGGSRDGVGAAGSPARAAAPSGVGSGGVSPRGGGGSPSGGHSVKGGTSVRGESASMAPPASPGANRGDAPTYTAASRRDGSPAWGSGRGGAASSVAYSPLGDKHAASSIAPHTPSRGLPRGSSRATVTSRANADAFSVSGRTTVPLSPTVVAGVPPHLTSTPPSPTRTPPPPSIRPNSTYTRAASPTSSPVALSSPSPPKLTTAALSEARHREKELHPPICPSCLADLLQTILTAPEPTCPSECTGLQGLGGAPSVRDSAGGVTGPQGRAAHVIRLPDPSRPFTIERLRTLKAAFDQVDIDRNGSMSSAELLARGGWVGDKFIDKATFTKMDRKGTGAVEFEQFVHLIYPNVLPTVITKMSDALRADESGLSEGLLLAFREAFNEVDVMRRGRLGLKQLETSRPVFGSRRIDRHAFHQIDVDGRGSITLAQIVAFLHSIPLASATRMVRGLPATKRAAAGVKSFALRGSETLSRL